jgi:TfoX/Sxy family transcriptional regulator of competence genes
VLGGVHDLLDRVRALLAGDDSVEEKRMVGGRSFLREGRLCCGVSRGGLVVRVGAAGMPWALAQPHVSAMTMRGRPLAAYVVVAPEGLSDDAELARWVRRGFASID